MTQFTMMLQPPFKLISSGFVRAEGQDFIEYALILAVVVVVAVGAYEALGSEFATAFAGIVSAVRGTL